MTSMDEFGGSFLESDGLNSLFETHELDTDSYQQDDLVEEEYNAPALPEHSDPLEHDSIDDSDLDDHNISDFADPNLEMELEDPSATDADFVEPEPPVEGQDPSLEDDGVYGSSHEWHSDWFYQEVDGYCGPTSAAIIVNEFFDAGITDPEYMVNQAYELGLTEDISQGMYMADVQTLLEAQGVPCENVTSSMDDLAARLEDGYGVIAFVDAGEIWGQTSDAVTEDNMPDHFLVVTEINTNTGMVTLADPGSPDGNESQIPISEFEDAWADSNYEMIATTTADADLVDSTENPQLAIANVTRGEVIQ